MTSKLRPTVAALALLVPCAAALVAAPAHAQQSVVAAPTIRGIALNADNGLQPGSVLQLNLQASPNARSASVALGKSGVVIPLRQATPGNYVGSYTVRGSDRIDPQGQMQARLVTGSQTLTRSFTYPPTFQAQAMGAAPAPAIAPVNIERFVMRPWGRPEPGRELRFRLNGAPGGDAWLDIPGVISGVDLAETRPGVYEGSYTVRRRDDPDAFRDAVASLRFGNQKAVTARVDREREGGPRDDRSPSIANLTPANGDRVGERGRVQVSAALGDEGSGVDPASVRLRIDGRDVTGDARVTPEEVSFRDNLPPGRHTVEVSVRDRAGNSTTKSWAFDVTERERDGRYGGGPLPLRVTSPENGEVVDANGNLQVQGRTVPGAAVRVQIEAISGVGGVIGLTQPIMDQTVQADRDGSFDVSVRPRSLPLPGTRYEVKLTVQAGNQTAEERITVRQRQG